MLILLPRRKHPIKREMPQTKSACSTSTRWFSCPTLPTFLSATCLQHFCTQVAESQLALLVLPVFGGRVVRMPCSQGGRFKKKALFFASKKDVPHFFAVLFSQQNVGGPAKGRLFPRRGGGDWLAVAGRGQLWEGGTGQPWLAKIRR